MLTIAQLAVPVSRLQSIRGSVQSLLLLPWSCLHIIIPLGVDASGSLTFVIVRKCLRQADFTKKGGLSDHNCGTPRAKGLHWISPGPGADVRAAEGRVRGKGHMERQSQ